MSEPDRLKRAALKNTALNLTGTIAPFVAALVAFPLLNRFFGAERVGYLTLAWALIGYLSFFDLGIGRALTKLMAEGLTGSSTQELHRLVWTALLVMSGLGVLAGAVLAAAAPWLAGSALRIGPSLRDEATIGLRVLALGVPFAVVTAGLRGILEAQGRFLIANAVRAPLGVWLLLAPLLLVPFGSRHLGWMIALLVLGRVLAWLAYTWACLRGLPGLLGHLAVARVEVSRLLLVGGWMTVSNVVGPLMIYLDRFVVGNRVSLQAVAWYATPFEVVTKVLVIPSAVAGVLFPLFAFLWPGRSGEAGRMCQLASRYMALAIFPLTFLVALFAEEWLSVWLGAEFAQHGTAVVRWLAFGCLATSVAHVPFALLQGAGHPDLTAKVHLLELPIYVALVIALTAAFGIAGAAAAWAIRTSADLLVLEALARRRSPERLERGSWLGIAAAIGLFALCLLPMSVALKAGIAALVLVGEAVLVWTVLLDQDGLGHLKGRVCAALGLPSP